MSKKKGRRDFARDGAGPDDGERFIFLNRQILVFF